MKNKMGLSIKLILAIFAIVIIGILVPKEVRADTVLSNVCKPGDYVNYPIVIEDRTINTSWRVFEKSGSTVKLISAIPVLPRFATRIVGEYFYFTDVFVGTYDQLISKFSEKYTGVYTHVPKWDDPEEYNFYNSKYASSWSLTPVGNYYSIMQYLQIEDQLRVSSENAGYFVVLDDEIYYVLYNGTGGNAQFVDYAGGAMRVRPIITLKSGITTSGLNTSGTWVLSVPTPTTPTTPTTTTEKGLRVNPNGGTWNSSTATQKFTQSTGTTKTIANPIAPSGKTVAFNYNGGIQGTLSMRTNSFVGWTFAGGGTFNNGVYTFADVGGTLNAEYSGNNIILPSAIRYGFEFLGWYTAQTGGTRVGGVGDSYTPTSTTYLYAHWKISDGSDLQYDKSTMSKLTVDPNGGIWNGSTQKQVFVQNFDTTMNIPKPIAPTGNIVAFNYNGGLQGNLKTNLKLDFKGWVYTYGDMEGTLTANYGGNMVTLPTSSREGFIFDGWYTDKLAGTRVGGAGDLYTPVGTQLLYAHWKTTESSTVTLVLNGTVDKTDFSLLAMADAGGYEISNYKFYVDESLYKTVTTSEKQVVCEVTDRTEGTSYNCYVVVTNSEGQTKQSNTVKVKTISSTSQSEESKILAECCEIGDYVNYPVVLDGYVTETSWRVLSKTGGVKLIAADGVYPVEPNSYGLQYNATVFSNGYLETMRTSEIRLLSEGDNSATRWTSEMSQLCNGESSDATAAYGTKNFYDSRYATGYRLSPIISDLNTSIRDQASEKGVTCSFDFASPDVQNANNWSSYQTTKGENLISNGKTYWIAGDWENIGYHPYYKTLQPGQICWNQGSSKYNIRPVVTLKSDIKTSGTTVYNGNLIWKLETPTEEIPSLGNASVSPTTWTNEKVTVTLPKETGITTKYGTSSSAINQTYTEPFLVNSNCTIYYQYTSETQLGAVGTLSISNIDKSQPTTATCSVTGTPTTSSFTLTAIGEDENGGSGVASYKFYVGGSLYKTVDSTSGSATCLVTGRTHSQNYECYVVVTDKAGNIKQSSSVTATTDSMSSASGANVNTTDWASSVVVTLPIKSGFTTKFGTSSSSITSSYTAPFTVTSNRTIYYQYTDGINVGGYGTLTITNIDTTGPNTATCSVSANTTGTSFTLSATGSDSGSGVASYKFYVAGSLYKTVTTTSSSATCNVTGRTAGTSYSCYVVVTDKAGNTKQSSSITVNTPAPNIIGDYVYYPVSYTGIDTKSYTANNGWRVLNVDSSGNPTKLIATAPMAMVRGDNFQNHGTEYDYSIASYFAQYYLGTTRTSSVSFSGRYNYNQGTGSTVVTLNPMYSPYATSYKLAPTVEELDGALKSEWKTKYPNGFKTRDKTSSNEVWTKSDYNQYEYATDLIADATYPSYMYNNYWTASEKKINSYGNYAWAVGGEGDFFGITIDREFGVRPTIQLKSGLKTSNKNSSGAWVLTQ